jgi:hypothetical protein
LLNDIEERPVHFALASQVFAGGRREASRKWIQQAKAEHVVDAFHVAGKKF